MTNQTELEALKTRADQMGLKYHHNIGVGKLRKMVNEALGQDTEDEDETDDSNAVLTPQKNPALARKFERESIARRKQEMIDEAAKLVRVRVTCMNPNKKDWEGEMYTVSNKVVGTFKKYVPFNADEGWHVPNIIYKHMKDRKCQVFQTLRDDRGNKIRKGKIIPELSIEVMPDLTVEELNDLKVKQARANTGT